MTALTPKLAIWRALNLNFEIGSQFLKSSINVLFSEGRLQNPHGYTGSPSAICVGSGFTGHLVEFGQNILELLVYYLMLNKCKNLKDMKSSCLSVCTSSLYDNEGRYFLHYYM